jgi:diguanylate cyclase (GGDEF)-like protein/PAS domain S-box-containing protein
MNEPNPVSLPLRALLLSTVVALLYATTGWLGLQLAMVGSSVTLIWPPTGIAVGAYLRYGRAVLPGIFVGALVVNLVTSGPNVVFSLLVAVGNTLPAIVAGWGLARVRVNDPLENPRAAIVFASVGAAGACVFSALVGSVSLGLTGMVGWAEAAEAFPLWWLGDSIGVLVVAPLVWSAPLASNWRLESRLQLAELLVFGAAMWVLFRLLLGAPATPALPPLSFAALLLPMWAALRFPSAIVSLVIVLEAGLVVYSTANGFGPFARESVPEALFYAHLFSSALASIGLMMSVSVNAQQAANRDLRRTLHALSTNERRLKDLTQTVPGMVYQWFEDPSGAHGFTWVSPYSRVLLGIDPQELIRDWTLFRIHPDDQERWQESVTSSSISLTEWTFEGRFLTADGRVRWWQGRSRPERQADGRLIYNGIVLDITAQKEIELALVEANRKITELAYSDSLTGLPNRLALVSRVEQIGTTAAGALGALFYVDIDFFKKINDSWGHDTGDTVLRHVAARLQAFAAGCGGVPARLGGDEFVVLVHPLPESSRSSHELCMTLSAELMQWLQRDVEGPDGTPIRVSASVGVALFDGANAQAAHLLREADEAMYQAKSGGRDQVTIRGAAGGWTRTHSGEFKLPLMIPAMRRTR